MMVGWAPPVIAKLHVVVSIVPQVGIVRDIVGDCGTVDSLIPANSDPHWFELLPHQVRQLVQADLIIFNGLFPFETSNRKLIQSQNKSVKIVDGSQFISVLRDTDTDHGGRDPHYWLSVRCMRQFARTAATEIIQADPRNRRIYERNAANVDRKLADLDRQLVAKFSKKHGYLVMIYHPALAYFARDYKLTLVPIEWEGKSPDAGRLTRVYRTVVQHRIGSMLVQRQTGVVAAKSIASRLGLRVILFDPMQSDYESMMLGISDLVGQSAVP